MNRTAEETAEKDALIFEIKGNSLDDGPGIRTVVFFKGCPLHCVWCHNPESFSTRIELSYDRRECIGCDSCVDVCPHNALDRDSPFFIDKRACTLCMKCVEVCPSGALSQVGRYISVEDVIKKISLDIPFFRTSGGGVTLSGGEPTLYMPYISHLLKELKKMGISTLIETCGLFVLERFMDLCYPWLDTIFYDIKLFDAEEHRTFCGVPNDVILENFKGLSTMSHGTGTVLLPRIPLVPGITATRENLEAIASFLRDTGHRRVELLPYNPLWRDKLEKIGEKSLYAEQSSMKTWMDRESLGSCQEIFSGFELL
ncbi:MAG: glycyl-radical enzyme activating protein [Desulfomonilia bacterium]